jgi:hypothetical protein
MVGRRVVAVAWPDRVLRPIGYAPVARTGRAMKSVSMAKAAFLASAWRGGHEEIGRRVTSPVADRDEGHVG